MRLALRSLCLVCLLLHDCCNSWADDASSPPNVTQLAEQVQRQQQQLDDLQQQLNSRQAQPAPGNFLLLDRDLFLHRATGDNDFRPRVNVIGRLHIDSQFASQTTRNEEIFGELLNSAGFRRARLGAEGDIHRDVYWKTEFDFAGGDIAFRDVYVSLQHLPLLNEIRVGHFREPFSLEGSISSNVMPFMERSTINQYDPGRSWGVGMFTWNPEERMTLALGIFRSGANRNGDVASNDNDLAYDVKVTGLPFYQESDDDFRMMHLGGAVSYRFPLNNTVQFSPKRDLVVADDSPSSPLTTPIVIASTDWQLYNLAWALVLNSFTLEAEWTGAYIRQISNSPVFLHGFYVQASCFLTGEHRRYDRHAGTFDQVQVLSPWQISGNQRGSGAWELALRFDYNDQRDENLPEENNVNLRGRILTGTLGINWYLNNYTRLMCNYTYAVPQEEVQGPSAAHLFGVRFAIYW